MVLEPAQMVVEPAKIGIRRGLTIKKMCFNIIRFMYNNNELSQVGHNVMNDWHIIIIMVCHLYYLP